MNITADVLGRVIKITTPHPKGGINKFTIHAETINRDVVCLCSYFCPVDVSDSVYARGTVQEENGVLMVSLTQPPFVLLSMDKDTVCHLIARQKITHTNVVSFYSILKARGVEPAITLDKMAVQYHHSQNLSQSYSPFVSDTQLKKVLEWWYKHRVLRRLYLFGLTNTEIRGSWLSEIELYEKILDNPYTIPSLSMDKCAEIKIRSNQVPLQSDLIGGMILRQLLQLLKHGQMYVSINYFPQMLEHRDLILSTYPIKLIDDDLILEYPWVVETKIVEWLKTHVSQQHPPIDKLWMSRTLSPDQIEAIETALTHNISLITGPAGTGKTTVIGQIVHHLQQTGQKYWAASFTGKAVSRLKQVVPESRCRTIHRLLQKGSAPFRYLILDEVSMISNDLIYRLLTTWEWDFQIILVGDIHQLPPIGWGSFLSQIMKIPNFPIAHLRSHHRFGDCGIAINSQRIVNCPNDESFQFSLSSDFTVVDGGIEILRQIVNGFHQAGVNINDFRIITPYNREIAEINKYVLDVYFSSSDEIVDSSGRIWKIGMPVMMTGNNYKHDIMNGEEGQIIGKGKDHVKIQFKNEIFQFAMNVEEVVNDEDETEHLHLGLCLPASAITCHRSQGSEWKYVIAYFPANPANVSFLTKNLIYTTITRGKTAAWIVGSIVDVQMGVHRLPSVGVEKLATRVAKN